MLLCFLVAHLTLATSPSLGFRVVLQRCARCLGSPTIHRNKSIESRRDQDKTLDKGKTHWIVFLVARRNILGYIGKILLAHITLVDLASIRLQRLHQRVLVGHAIRRHLALRAKFLQALDNVVNQEASRARRIELDHGIVFRRDKGIRWTGQGKELVAHATKVLMRDQVGHKVE